MNINSIKDLLLRPLGVIVLGAVVGLVGWGVGGLVVGAVGGVVLSLLIGVVVNRLQGGPVPREYRHDLVEKVLDRDRDTVRSVYSHLDESDWFDAVEEDLNSIIERAVSEATTPGSAWDAQNVLKAATKLSLEQDTEERQELYRVLGGHIQNEWYLKEHREARDEELEARKKRIGDFVYNPLESGGETVAHTLGTTTDDVEKSQGTTIRRGAELQLTCGPKAPPHGEINLLTGAEPSDDEVRVEWGFDDRSRHEARWTVESGVTMRATECLTLDDSQMVRSFVSEAMGAERLTLSFEGADGRSVRHSFGLKGLAEGLEHLPCFQD